MDLKITAASQTHTEIIVPEAAMRHLMWSHGEADVNKMKICPPDAAGETSPDEEMFWGDAAVTGCLAFKLC